MTVRTLPVYKRRIPGVCGVTATRKLKAAPVVSVTLQAVGGAAFGKRCFSDRGRHPAEGQGGDRATLGVLVAAGKEKEVL